MTKDRWVCTSNDLDDMLLLENSFEKQVVRGSEHLSFEKQVVRGSEHLIIMTAHDIQGQ